jgi:hypothetical protein
MATIPKIENNKCWQRGGKIGTLVYYWWECKMVPLLWQIVWCSEHMKKIELPYDPEITFWVYSFKKI